MWRIGNVSGTTQSTPVKFGWLPALGWLRAYQPGWLRGDLVAGITLAAYLLPAGLGDASLANLPPEAGLYACLFSGLVFWLFCSSRHTAITVTSAISLLLGATLGEIAGGDASRFVALAGTTALLVALIAFVAWLARAGNIIRFISESVLTGFKAGVALYLASTQLPKLLGLHGAHGDFFEMIGHLLRNVHETNPVSLALGLAALAVLIAGKLFLKNRPVAIVVVIAGIAGAMYWDVGAQGVKLLGEVPQGIPWPALPRSIDWGDVVSVRKDLNALLPLALACFVLGAVETAAIGRMFTAKHGGRFDSNQEFLGLAVANLAAGLGQGYPVSGGMSQSLVNESGGARTPLSGFIAALLVLLVIIFLSGMLSYLPQPVLAAIVLVAVAGLFKADVLMHLWRFDRGEFAVAMAALFGVLASGLLRGVLVGAVISLFLVLRAASRPRVALLGRIPGTQRFSDRDRHPDNEPVAGLVIVRPESGLFYFNADHVRDTIMERIAVEVPRPQLLICDFSAVPRLDMHAAQMLHSLHDDLAAQGIGLQIVETHAGVRDRLRQEGLEDKAGGVSRFKSLEETVAVFVQGRTEASKSS